MWFNIFKRKKKVVEEPKTFEGRFISDEEFKEMIRAKNKTFIEKEFETINDMMKEVKQYYE